MKHTALLTATLLLLFFFSQLIGLFIISEYIDIEETSLTGNTTLNQELYFIAPPEVENESFSFLYLLIPILLGTIILVILAKYNLFSVWKWWFFISIVLALFIAIHPFVSRVFESFLLSLLIAIIFAYLKLKKPHFVTHNVTELLIYGGIAALFVPMLNVLSVFILLFLISIYDVIAVNMSKHMILMAKFQTKHNAFAGLQLPRNFLSFSKKKHSSVLSEEKMTSLSKKHSAEKKLYKSDSSLEKTTKETSSSSSSKESFAILGGGDIAFPLLFSGVVLKTYGLFLFSIITSFGALLGLLFLFLISKRGKFYPAMPFITIGIFSSFFLGFFLLV